MGSTRGFNPRCRGGKEIEVRGNPVQRALPRTVAHLAECGGWHRGHLSGSTGWSRGGDSGRYSPLDRRTPKPGGLLEKMVFGSPGGIRKRGVAAREPPFRDSCGKVRQIPWYR